MNRKRTNKRKRRMKFLITVACATVIFFSVIVKADLYGDKERLENKIREIENQTSQMRDRLFGLQQEIEGIDSDLVDIGVEITQTEESIKDTENKIQIKQQQIQDEILVLMEEQDNKNKQYQAMKKRIQYFYEEGGDNQFIVLLSSQSIGQFLNRGQYIRQLHKVDRQKLEKYIETVEKVKELKEKLEIQEADLQQKKGILKLEKQGLEQNQQRLEKKIEELKQQEERTGISIENNIQSAAALAYEITQINRQIAAKEAEQERIKQEQAQRVSQTVNKNVVISETETGPSYYQEEEYSQEIYDQPQQEEVQEEYIEQQYDAIAEQPAADIVSYANQFVGYPYVWGGNSLTNGCDCSHFVWNVLKNTGHYSGGYSTSGGWAYLGSPVSSLSSAIAGDIIVYSGHVAIYDGNGCIIQAQSSSAGITNYRSASCSTIVAIRRF